MSVMPVCKFFLNGNCRFGDRCRFRHPYEQNNDYYGNDNDYYLSSNHRTLIRRTPSPPPIGGGSSSVSFSFNKAHAASSTSKPNYSGNRFAALSDDEEMEDSYRGNSPRPGGSNTSQYKWTRPDLGAGNTTSSYFGKIATQPSTNQPVTFSFKQQHASIAPEHAGLFKPKPTNQISPSSPSNVNFSFVRPTTNIGTTNNQGGGGLFGRSSFTEPKTNQAVNVPHGLFGRSNFSSGTSGNSSTTMFGQVPNAPQTKAMFGQVPTAPQTKAMFGRPEVSSQSQQKPSVLFGKPVEMAHVTPQPIRSQDTSLPKSVLCDSSFLDELGYDLYSTLEKLSEVEKNCYFADMFDLKMVPLNPPPRELCF